MLRDHAAGWSPGIVGNCAGVPDQISFGMRDQETAHGHVRRSDIFHFQIKAAHIGVMENAAIEHVQPDRVRRLRLVLCGWSGLRAANRWKRKKDRRGRGNQEQSNHISSHNPEPRSR